MLLALFFLRSGSAVKESGSFYEQVGGEAARLNRPGFPAHCQGLISIVIRSILMKITTQSVCILALFSVLSCEPSTPEQSLPTQEQEQRQEQDASMPTPQVPVVNNYAAWSCPANPGQAPSGEFTAERIESANSMSEEAGLYEGPVWLNGALYFSDFTFQEGFPSRIRRLNADGSLETIVQDSGSNGLAVDAEGYLIAGTHGNKAISRFNVQTSEREVIAGTFNDNPFNSPNDLTEARDGSVYFTDPAFQRDAAPGGQDKTSVYRIAADGSVSVVDDTIQNPNGISLSPAQDVLYVAGGGEQGFLRAYPIVDGVPGEGKNLVENISVPDGMAID